MRDRLEVRCEAGDKQGIILPRAHSLSAEGSQGTDMPPSAAAPLPPHPGPPRRSLSSPAGESVGGKALSSETAALKRHIKLRDSWELGWRTQ